MSKYIVTHSTAKPDGGKASPGDEIELNEDQAKSRAGQIKLVKEKPVEKKVEKKSPPKAKAKTKSKSKSED